MKYCIVSGVVDVVDGFICNGSKGNLVFDRVYRRIVVYHFVFFVFNKGLFLNFTR